ncbi:restriction endonuclease subunit S [Pantoea dispersa]|uniref:restriction endonuclease subunit S n=1 Tax=Pantoea dispersa TaxID=59814 RepID=UPI0024B85507|nr:restriction endonuclease subunit S [Pantoea dispersa]MDI9768596.1 restriction endonuclease subunit S [Pantoea dispersa]
MSVEKLITDHIDIWTSAMQTRSAAGRGGSGKVDLYGVKKLRELILELAVRGKLVPQDPNDEPASELLKRIAVEKVELVKQGKIKKQKPLAEISEDEKPFKLPVGWEFCQLGDFANIVRGITFPGNEKSKEASDNKIACLRTANIQENIDWNDLIYVPKEFIKRNDQILLNNDIVMSMANSRELVGKVALATISNKNTVTFGGFLSVLRPIIIDPKFLMLLLRCDTNKSQLIESSSQTTNIANISLAKLNPLIVGLPPLAEQAKITNSVDELLSICDQLEQQSLTSLEAHSQLVETLLATLTNSQNAEELAENWERISQHFDTLFTTEASIDALKQTILQLAVMGKLVPQDPNDEPASELLKRIEQEKAQLVKEGKIKKQKPLPPVSDEEKPFELPEGWEWCRIGNLGICSTGKTPSTNNNSFYSGNIPFIGPGDITSSGEMSMGDKFLSIDGAQQSTIARENDILTVCIGGSIGKCAVTDKMVAFNQQINCLSPLFVKSEYIYYVFKTSHFINQLYAYASGSATPIINRGKWEKLLISIPPKGELTRILNRLQQLLILCEILKSRLQSAQQTQLHLADALTDAALS